MGTDGCRATDSPVCVASTVGHCLSLMPCLPASPTLAFWRSCHSQTQSPGHSDWFGDWHLSHRGPVRVIIGVDLQIPKELLRLSN